ncbi:MAG TPA: hypothetical protein VLA66_06335 [Thermoanaerobaculia bacterium]|nr:hypothetical protein [Thermoanaerobaculia bacterium]
MSPLPGAAPGLCSGCRHARLLRSRRGVYLRCGRSDAEPRYRRYPSLPVLSCTGFEAASEGSAEAGGSAPPG